MRTQHSAFERILAAAAFLAMLAPISPAQQQSQQKTAPPQQSQQNQGAQSGQQGQQGPVDLSHGPAKPQQANKGGGNITVHTNLVQIDTFVTDKDGKPIKGLKPENFQLDEDGKRQKLEAVDYYDIEGVEKAAKPDESAAHSDIRASAPVRCDPGRRLSLIHI